MCTERFPGRPCFSPAPPSGAVKQGGNIARQLDIDGFEALNQAHGPHAGDEVLRRLGGVLRRETRQGDFTARYGGEEFALVAPHTNPFGMRTLAERLRRAVEAEVIEFEGHALSVTASFGAACIAEFDAPEDAQHLVKLVERLLCRAKEQGRNRSEVFSKVHFPTR